MKRLAGLGALRSPVSGSCLAGLELLTEVSTGWGANLRGGGGEDMSAVGEVKADVPDL